jgi:hypothetical protein
VDLKRLGFQLEAQLKRGLALQRPDPKHVDVTIGFCEEFALDDDEEEVGRRRVCNGRPWQMSTCRTRVALGVPYKYAIDK